jgi:hypothetical protein
MAHALTRHRNREARVIPVILRPCDWKHSPLGELQALPTDGQPITKFPDRDEAFLDVVEGLRKVLPPQREAREVTATGSGASTPKPRRQSRLRSSNLRVRRLFTDRERDTFLDESFEYIANYFENSLSELESRNPGISGRFTRIDARQFGVRVYRGGDAIGQCVIALHMERGGSGKGITYSSDTFSNGINEQLTVGDDGYMLHLEPMMGAMQGERNERHLTHEGAAELLWGRLIDPLQ